MQPHGAKCIIGTPERKVIVSTVKAYPRKQFFIEMFTRDITLEDCILDLIDNAMDSYLRTRKINVSAEVFGQSDAGAVEHPGEIKIDFSSKEFSISDNCGGIDRKAAQEDVFCFGHAKGSKATGGLGVYGIGLKRAIFKLGNVSVIHSSNTEGSFDVRVDVSTWSQQEGDLATDWTFPITYHPAKAKAWEASTTITITGLHDEVKVRMNDEALDGKLRRGVSKTRAVVLGDP